MADQHMTDAEACLGQLGEQDDDSSVERSLLGRSIAHSLLTIARNMESIAGLRSAPPTPPTDPADVVDVEILDANPLHTAAALLEWAAIADEGEQRESTIARLMLHATGERYSGAPAIAQHALDGTTGQQHYAVAQAIVTLRIELPA